MTQGGTVEPTRWLNYPGERARHMDHMVGPAWDGQLLVPVESSYDAETDRTRIGFATLAALKAAAEEED